jgi:hypothetical protein
MVRMMRWGRKNVHDRTVVDTNPQKMIPPITRQLGSSATQIRLTPFGYLQPSKLKFLPTEFNLKFVVELGGDVG